MLARRAIQTTSSESGEGAEAFLEEAKPGISFLQLNRPKAKNAISLRLLKVRNNNPNIYVYFTDWTH